MRLDGWWRHAERAGSLTADRGVVGALVAGSLALPLIFWPLADDVFALPKLLGMALAAPALLGGVLAAARPSSRLALGPTTWTGTALVLCLLVTGAATARSPDPVHSLTGERYQYQGLIATTCYAIAFLAARRSTSTAGRLRAVLAAIAIAGAGAAGYGLVQQAGLDPIWHELDKGRIFSTFGQANALAAFLVLALPASLALAVGTSPAPRTATLAAAAIGGMALALTMSRGGYLGALAALGTFAVLAGRRPAVTRRGAALALAGLAAALALAIAAPPARDAAARVVERVQVIADPAESSAASHLDLWAVGTRIALDHPLLGVGPERYADEFAAYRDAVLPPERAAVMARFRPESPHDVPLAIADGAGLLALTAYLALVAGAMGTGLRRLRRAAPAERALLAGALAACAGHLVTDLFMTAETAGTWIFWALLGALAAAAVPEGPRPAFNTSPAPPSARAGRPSGPTSA